MSAKKNYGEKLRDPRWQKKRLEVFERDNWTCQACGDFEEELQVHHMKYKGEPWEVALEDLETLCWSCHQNVSEFQKVMKRQLRIPEELETISKPKAIRWIQLWLLFEDYMELVEFKHGKEHCFEFVKDYKELLFFHRIVQFAYGGERIEELIKFRIENKRKQKTEADAEAESEKASDQ